MQLISGPIHWSLPIAGGTARATLACGRAYAGGDPGAGSDDRVVAVSLGTGPTRAVAAAILTANQRGYAQIACTAPGQAGEQ